MKKMLVVASSLLLANLLSACATGGGAPSARAVLEARSGSSVAGEVVFTGQPGGLRVTVAASGLSPGEHGFHIHEIGDCSAPDATSAKGHYNPAGKAHGHHASNDRHGGDLPNLTADARGEARFAADLPGLTLDEIYGRSVVIHADPDDYKSQPAGNSGKRVACGVIVRR